MNMLSDIYSNDKSKNITTANPERILDQKNGTSFRAINIIPVKLMKVSINERIRNNSIIM